MFPVLLGTLERLEVLSLDWATKYIGEVMEKVNSTGPLVSPSEKETMLLVVSQLFFTSFGSLFNLFLFLTLKDLPQLSASTYHILLTNTAAANLFVCTIVKSTGSIYISYAFSKV